MAKFQKIKCKASKEKCKFFMDTVKEFNKISDIHRLKILDNKIVFYTIKGENKQIDIFKCVILDKNDLFDGLDTSFVNEFIIPDSVTFLKKFDVLYNTMDEYLEYEFIYDQDAIYTIKTASVTWEMTFLTADKNAIRDFKLEDIKEKLNVEYAIGSFGIKSSDIKHLIKTCKINSNENLCLEMLDNNAIFSESDWKLSIPNAKSENTKLEFRKIYLNYLHLNRDELKFYIFDYYLVVKENNNYLLMNKELGNYY